MGTRTGESDDTPYPKMRPRGRRRVTKLCITWRSRFLWRLNVSSFPAPESSINIYRHIQVTSNNAQLSGGT